MADSKVSALTETLDILDNDLFYIVKASDLTKGYKIAGSTLLKQVGAKDGYVPIQGACTYASAYSFTIAGDYSAIIEPGDLIMFTQTTIKYFAVTGVAYQMGLANTLISGRTGSDYTLVNAAITLPYYKHGGSKWFNITAPTWTTTGTAFTNQPTTNVAKFALNGRVMTVYIKATCHATSGGTGVFIATFPTGQLPGYANAGSGSAFNHSTVLGGTCWVSTTEFNVVRMSKYDGTALATNSNVFTATLVCEI